jgi:hypothetical protein
MLPTRTLAVLKAVQTRQGTAQRSTTRPRPCQKTPQLRLERLEDRTLLTILYDIATITPSTQQGLFQLDRETGDSTLLGTLSTPLNAIAFNPIDTLYGLNGRNGTIYRINPNTAAETPILTSSLLQSPTVIASSAFTSDSDGNLFFLSSRDFVEVNPHTMQVIPLGSGDSLLTYTGLAFAPDGTLFAEAASAYNTDNIAYSLYRVNPSNGATTLVGNVGNTAQAPPEPGVFLPATLTLSITFMGSALIGVASGGTGPSAAGLFNIDPNTGIVFDNFLVDPPSTLPVAILGLPDGSELQSIAAPFTPPDLVMDQATTKDATNVCVTYDINNASITGQSLPFEIYRSSTTNGHDIPIALATVPQSDATDLSVGHHTNVQLTLHYLNSTGPQNLAPDPLHPYIVVQADSDGSITESPGSVNTTYFRTYLLGVLSHGFAFTLSSHTPGWEINIGNELKADDHYDDFIAFNWMAMSRSLASGQAVAAGNQLYSQVVTKAHQLVAGHPGDVVDLHFIGHSRGTVVVSQAMQDLVGTTDPALQGSYIKATLLDPHPANILTTGLLYSSFPLTSRIVLPPYLAFELADRDPQVVVPKNVKYTDVYYQHSSYLDGFIITDPAEFALNLWGEGPADGIINQSSAPIQWRNLTDVVEVANGPTGLPIGPIGHSEVYLWYDVHVVSKGLAASVSGVTVNSFAVSSIRASAVEKIASTSTNATLADVNLVLALTNGPDPTKSKKV